VTVDAVIVGKFVGDEALAAVGSVGSLTGMIIGLFLGISAGASVVIAQYYGAKNVEKMQNAVHTAMAFSIIGSLVMTVFGVAASPFLLRLMNSPPNVIGMSTTYLQIYFIGMLPALLYNMGAGILRAVGDSRRPLYYLVISAIINILLDLLFVVVFKLGVVGAAVATPLAQCAAAILVLINLTTTHDIHRVIPRKIKFHAEMIKRIVIIGIPTGLQSVVIAFSNVIIQTKINSFGDIAMAAWVALMRIDGFIYVIMAASGIAMTSFIGQNYGAKRYDRIKQSVKVSLAMTCGVTFGLAAIMVIFARQSFLLFTDNEAVIEIGIIMLYWIVPLYGLFSVIEILSGTIRGTGNSIMPMAISLIGMCGLRLVWVLGIMLIWNTIIMLCLCYPVTWVVTSGVLIFYYFKVIKRLEKT